jgi:hypothetical protein
VLKRVVRSEAESEADRLWYVAYKAEYIILKRVLKGGVNNKVHGWYIYEGVRYT